MLVRDLLVRGMLAGLLAGALAFGVAKILGEPPVGKAEAFETRQRQLSHERSDQPIVSRDVQSTLGLGTGVLAIGTTFGGLCALAFAFAYGRIGRVGPRGTAMAVAVAGFVGMYLVPFLKYPANPPSIGQPSTIGYRSELYFAMLSISIALTIATVVLGRRLAARLGAWNAALFAAAAFLVATAAVYLVMPGVNEVPQGFPAGVLWSFRMASLATQASLWIAMGLIFGVLIERWSADRGFVLRRRG